MRLLIKLIIIVAVIAGIYLGYKYFVEGEIPQDVIQRTAEGVKTGTKASAMAKANGLYTRSKYEEAIEQYTLALKEEKLEAGERQRALQRLGDCHFKLWEWDRSRIPDAKKAKAVYEAYGRKYPKDASKVARPLEKLRSLANLK